VRRRLLGTLLAGQGIASSAYFAAVTAASVLTADLLTTRTWAGLPVAVGVLGSAASVPLSRYMGRAGRRRGLVLGYVAGAVGAGIGLAAAVARSFPLLVAAMLLVGAGQAANQLARYAAADVVTEAGRGKAISLVVWGATIGALFGPTCLSRPVGGPLGWGCRNWPARSPSPWWRSRPPAQCSPGGCARIRWRSPAGSPPSTRIRPRTTCPPSRWVPCLAAQRSSSRSPPPSGASWRW
jgi:MFS family permease